MARLFAQVSKSPEYEKQRETDVLGQYASKIAALAAIANVPETEIQNDIKDKIGNWSINIPVPGRKEFKIPTPFYEDIDKADLNMYLNQQIAQRTIDQIDQNVLSGEDEPPEDWENLKKTIKAKFELNKTPVDYAGEYLQGGVEAVSQFKNIAGQVATNQGGSRDNLLKNITSAIAKQKYDGSFIESLAWLGAEALIDDIPTGVIQAGQDIHEGLTGGAVTNLSRVQFDAIKNSPMSGKSVQQLEHENPVAAFIAASVPYVLMASRQPKETANWLAKTLKMGAAEVLQENTLPQGEKDKGYSKSVKERGLNSMNTFFAAIGFDRGTAGVRKLANKLARNGVPMPQIIKQVTNEALKRAETAKKNPHVDKLRRLYEPISKRLPKKPVVRKIQLRPKVNVKVDAFDIYRTGTMQRWGKYNQLWVRFGAASIGEMFGTGPILHAAALRYAQTVSIFKSAIQTLNTAANEMKARIASELGVSEAVLTKKHLNSGAWRAWRDGLVDERNIKPEVLDAYKNLKTAYAEYNQKYIFPAMEKVGYITKKDLENDLHGLDPSEISNAAKGDLVGIVDVMHRPNTRQALLDTGLKLVEVKQDGKTIKAFAILEYGDFEKGILKKFQDGKEFYQKKYPYLYDKKGKFRSELVTFERNTDRQYLDLLPEFEKLDVIQLDSLHKTIKQNRDRLEALGYVKEDIDNFLKLVVQPNINPATVRGGYYKMFVGSLKKRKEAKIGVALDPIDTGRRQAIDLNKKWWREENVPKIKEAQYAIEKKIQEGRTLTDDQIFALRAEHDGLRFIENAVRNRPDWIEERIMAGISLITGKERPELYLRALRTASDKYLGAQSVLKLWGNVSGSVANVIEAVRFMGEELANGDLKTSAWDKLFAELANPYTFVQNTRKEMKASKYASLYLEDVADASVNTAYKNTKKAKGINWYVKGIKDAGMLPFTGSIQWGKSYIYRLAGMVADNRGLTGQAKDDYIFQVMARKAQIQDIGVSSLANNSFSLKSVLFLKNYLVRSMYYETDAVLRFLKHPIQDKAARNTILFYTTVPVLLAGAHASPTLNILNSLVWAGSFGNVDLMKDAKSDKTGNIIKNIAARGLVGTLSGIATNQISIDPLVLGEGLETTIVGQDVMNAIDFISYATTAAQVADALDQPELYWLTIGKKAKQILRKEVSVGNRIGKAIDVLQTGKIKSAAGNVSAEVPENRRKLEAVLSASGVQSAETEMQTTTYGRAMSEDEKRTLKRKQLVEMAITLEEQNRSDLQKGLRQYAKERDIEVSDEMLKNAKMKKDTPALRKFLKQKGKGFEKYLKTQTNILDEHAPDYEEKPDLSGTGLPENLEDL